MNAKPSHGAKTQQKTLPFPLELVAQVATALVVHGRSTPSLEGSRKEAADLAVRMLEACEERLINDAAIKEAEQQKRQDYDSTHGKRQRAIESLQEKHGSVVPWKKAILCATSQTQLSRALPRYRHYLLYRQKEFYERAKRTESFDRYIVVPPEPTKVTMQEELKRIQKRGFTPVETVHEQVSFSAWYEELGKLEARRRGGQVRAQKKSSLGASKG